MSYSAPTGIREGFEWEIDQIVSRGLQSRVVIVLPCIRDDWGEYRCALGQADVILDLLNRPEGQTGLEHFSVQEYERQLDATPLLMKYKKNGTLRCWSTLPEGTSGKAARRAKRKKLTVSDKTYLQGLTEALEETKRDLSGLDFATRYP